MSKLDGLVAAALYPNLYGDAVDATLLVCWGSTLGAALEAVQRLDAQGETAAVLHFSQVYPLVGESFLPVFAEAKRTVMVEGNSVGQLARLIRRETGYVFDALVTRYDGLPLTAAYILERL